jgi:hypothetical protein
VLKINKTNRKRAIIAMNIIAIIATVVLVIDSVIYSLFYSNVPAIIQIILSFIPFICFLFQTGLISYNYEKALIKIKKEAFVVLFGTIVVIISLLLYDILKYYRAIILVLVIIKIIVDCLIYSLIIRKISNMSIEDINLIRQIDYYKEEYINADNVDQLLDKAKQHYILCLFIGFNTTNIFDGFLIYFMINIAAWTTWAVLEMKKFKLFFKTKVFFIRTSASLIPVLFGMIGGIVIKFYAKLEESAFLIIVVFVISLLWFLSENKKIYTKVLRIKEKESEIKMEENLK